ncbi:MAG: pseudouridine synthase [Bacteroidales bacterium]|nr:pseudouridine synthase [Bacteroidales bacterium]
MAGQEYWREPKQTFIQTFNQPGRRNTMEDNRRGGNGRRTEGRREYGERKHHQNSNGERRSFSSDRPRRSYSDNGERRSYGNNERRSFGEHSERKSFGGDRPRRSFSDNGERRSFSSDRPRRSYSDNGERRSYGNNERRSFGENSERRSFGSDRPRRSFSDNGERRSYGNRNERRGFGNSGRKSYNRKDLNYFRNEDESGISRMISRRPQVDGAEYSDNDMVKTPIKEEIRLNKFIANSGVCSRREADNFILAGVVTVNGEVVTELGTKVNIKTDDIRFNGERLKGEDKVYIVMNKPKGYVTTASDPHADKTVMDLLKNCNSRVFPVGRLDKNTTGVLMFTNDGEIAEKLTHPSYDKKKIYQVSLDSKLKQEDYEKILSGVELNDGIIAADELEYIEEDDHRKLGIEIHSGKNRIVRRIFESLGYEVKALDRVYFAGLTKKGLKRGEWRFLTEGETNLLKMGAYI